jgi:hypothetical protein
LLDAEGESESEGVVLVVAESTEPLPQAVSVRNASIEIAERGGQTLRRSILGDTSTGRQSDPERTTRFEPPTWGNAWDEALDPGLY